MNLGLLGSIGVAELALIGVIALAIVGVVVYVTMCRT